MTVSQSASGMGPECEVIQENFDVLICGSADQGRG